MYSIGCKRFDKDLGREFPPRFPGRVLRRVRVEITVLRCVRVKIAGKPAATAKMFQQTVYIRTSMVYNTAELRVN